MVLVKANKDSEAGVMPTQQELANMGAFNEQLVKAGIMQAGEGLHPSSKGVRLKFVSGGEPVVTRGPFGVMGELVSGFWLWQCESMEAAIDWLKKAPFRRGEELEIRKIFEAADFGAEFSPELREQEEKLRAEIEKKA